LLGPKSNRAIPIIKRMCSGWKIPSPIDPPVDNSGDRNTTPLNMILG
jgi:hypothetical protein